MKPPAELTIVHVTTTVNVTRSPALSVVPSAGTIESSALKSVVGVVGLLLPQLEHLTCSRQISAPPDRCLPRLHGRPIDDVQRMQIPVMSERHLSSSFVG